MPTTDTVPNTTVEKQSKPDFGEGRYSPLMEECYNDAIVVFRLSSEKAEKLAKAIARDVGSIMASRPVEVKTTKPSKEGKITLSEAAKVKGITMTNTLYALRALHFAAEAGRNGFAWAKTQWTPVQGLREYFETL
jgi:hypothetical protein